MSVSGIMSTVAAKAHMVMAQGGMQQAVQLSRLADDAVLPFMTRQLDDVGGALRTLASSSAQSAIGPRVNFANAAAHAVESLGVTARGGVMPAPSALQGALQRVEYLAGLVSKLS